MRPSKTNVTGKRFVRINGPSRQFLRRGKDLLSFNSVFLLILALAAAVISKDLKKYFYLQDVATVSTSDLVQIDLDKGDADGAFAPILDDNAQNAPSLEWRMNVEMYLDDGAKFSDASLEKGSPGSSYEREGQIKEQPRPVPLPPADAPVLFPRKVNGVDETEESTEQHRQETLLKRKRRKRETVLLWKRRQFEKNQPRRRQNISIPGP